MRFGTLVVCSGNICRSPLGERLLRSRLGVVPELGFGSAGTIANPGDPMPEPAQRLALSLGVDPDGHRARRLDERVIAASDLILVAAREHRSAVAKLVPSATRKTFTLREFARLAAGLTPADLPAAASATDALAHLVDVVASRRGLVDGPATPEDDDVIDPYRRSDAVYAQSAAELVPAVDAIEGAFRLALSRVA